MAQEVVTSPPGGPRPPCLSPTSHPGLRQDFHMMEQRKRVTLILQSQDFRDELESLIEEKTQTGKDPSGLLALQQIADLVLSTPGPSFPLSPPGMWPPSRKGPGGVVNPINDLRGTEQPGFARGERLLRCKMAALLRLIDLHTWGQLNGNLATVRVSKEKEHFLVNPSGLLFSEITSGSLLKVDIQGQLVEPGLPGLGLAMEPFSLHAALHAARPDARCIITTHTPAGAAVSALRCGLLPLSQAAVMLGPVSYHQWAGEICGESEREQLQRNLGPANKVLILRNHGILLIGESVEEAYQLAYQAAEACEVQLRALAGGCQSGLLQLDVERCKERVALMQQEMGGTGQRWRTGEQLFEAMMRMLDNMGYRTGYAYKHPLMREKPRKRSEVEVPATASAFSWDDDGGYEDTVGQDGVRLPLELLVAQRQRREKSRWLNSPNSYQRVELSGEQDQMRHTWQITEEGHMSGTAIRIEDPNQFVPLNTNLAEFKETRNKIREQNKHDVKTAGPKSHLLAGIVIENKPAAKEEIEPEGPSPPNPFGDLSEKDLEEYRREVKRKQGIVDGEGSPEHIGETMNGGDGEKQDDKRISQLTTSTTDSGDGDGKVAASSGGDVEEVVDGVPLSPDGSPTKSGKKKKKFSSLSFLKRKKEKSEA
uniref:gamma-adducin-like isoform X2 n=1 Tax=Myxine glutinosa TaxID=7769 RepID=UPI00358DFBBF